MQRMRSLATSLAFGLLSLATQARTCPADLRIAFLDKALPPMLMGEGSRFEDPPGRFVDWTRTALDAHGPGRAGLQRRAGARAAAPLAVRHRQ